MTSRNGKYYRQYTDEIEYILEGIKKHGIANRVFLTPKNDTVYNKPVTIEEWFKNCHFCDKIRTSGDIYYQLLQSEIKYKRKMYMYITTYLKNFKENKNFDIVDILYYHYIDLYVHTPNAVKNDIMSLKHVHDERDNDIAIYQIYCEKYGKNFKKEFFK